MFRRVREGVWEYPPEPPMRVPLRVYATKTILDQLEEGALRQGRNVASLPGIVKYSIMLPDAHQGYGFPIGGVAAFDVEEGVISPGGVGFDINCLPPGTPVLHPLGYTLPIERVVPSDSVVVLNDSHARPTEVGYALEDRREILYRIRTLSGHEIVLSADHPVRTPSGFRKVSESPRIVALYPFQGVPYEEPEHFTIVAPEDVPESVRAELERRDLLPLYSTSEKLPYLLRLFGYLLGDGVVYGKTVAAYGDRETLEAVLEDIRRLGYSGRIYSRRRIHRFRGRTFETVENMLKVSARSLVELLFAMGYPRGRKAESDFVLPAWLLRLPLWMKRLFLAGLFDAELSAPRTMNGYNFYMPELKHSRLSRLEERAREFLGQIQRLLEEFGVTSTISEAEHYRDRTILRLIIHENDENLIRLYTRIGFDYNAERRRRALAAIVYIGWKRYVREKRRELRRKIREMGREAFNVVRGVNRRFIERSLYEDVDDARIPRDMITFEDFLADFTEGDVVYDVVLSIEPVPHFGPVYDITVMNPHHNFVAAGFVVSNCGVRLIRTDLREEDVRPKLKQLIDTLFRNVPAGLGSQGKIRLSRGDLEEVMTEGVLWAVEHGYGWEEDPERIEENGRMEGANPDYVSDRAVKRGLPQLGSLGSGNHFLEVQRVERIYDEEIARRFGLFEGQVVVMVHTGSRGFGHQVASDYLVIMERAMRRYGVRVPDKQLAAVPFQTEEAQRYFSAMKAAVNYAFTNRQLITHWVRESFRRVFGSDAEEGMHIVYDVAHNIAKVEEHDVDGERRTLVVHRKGATRAFAAGRPEIPEIYRDVGQPVLIPGSMGTASYVLVGTETAMRETFGSTCHGAGRVLSRSAAVRRWRGEEIARLLERAGKAVRAASWKVLAEEAPRAYKDVDEVVRSVQVTGISRPIARMVPLGVVKG